MPKAISLFAGAGGCSLGFYEAGYQIIYASDINPQAMATYRLNFPDTCSATEDIAHIEFERLLSLFSLASGDLDIIIGGPPCQGP